MMLEQIPDTSFIGELSKNQCKISTKIETCIVIVKHKPNGDYISERQLTVPKDTIFTVKLENGKGFSVPSKSLYHIMIELEGSLKKEDNEVITFQEYKMTKDHFEKHFLVL